MAALAPSVSQAMGPGSASSWIEVCTSAGAKWAQADGSSNDQAPASPDAHPFEHCAYCSLHAGAAAIVAASACGFPVVRPASDLPIAFLAAPRMFFAWISAQPRAPPPCA